MLPVHIIRAGTAVSEPSDASTSSFSSGGTRDTGCRRLWYIQFFPRCRESFKSRWELARSGIQMAGGHILASSPCSRGAWRVATSVVDDCHDQIRYGALQREAGIFVEKKRSNDYWLKRWMGHMMLKKCRPLYISTPSNRRDDCELWAWAVMNSLDTLSEAIVAYPRGERMI